ncbi:unnamed protein product, partial [Laminaria digitata]
GGGSGSGWSASSEPGLPEPSVVDSGFKTATGHRQVGLLLQRGNKLRAGCRFALRVAETPEEVDAIRAERAETGVAWTKYEVPDDIELDRKAYPGLLTADSVGGGSGGGPGAGASGGGSNGGVSLPGAGAMVVHAGGGGGGGGGGGSGGEEDVTSKLYVALQGWVNHDMNDAEVGFRARVAGGSGGVVAQQVRRRCYGGGGGVCDLRNLLDLLDSLDLIKLLDLLDLLDSLALLDSLVLLDSLDLLGAAPLPMLEDEVTEALMREQATLRAHTQSLQGEISTKMTSLQPIIDNASDFSIKNDVSFKRLCRVQTWKKMVHKMQYGVADRPLNFNKVDGDSVDNLPPSWQRDVEGRQTREEAEAELKANAEAANKEDAVCMVCFDGSTDEDHNLYIVYCDGCGMSVHMDCYGIKNVEADFCCERCSKLRELEAESKKVNVEDVRCCLCPVIHGALKQTTCMRWAHMTCLMLIPGVRMDDLINKTRIDLSEANVDSYML